MGIFTFAKAIVGAAAAGLAAWAAALADGTVSQQEWLTVVIATLAGLALVYATPNRPPVVEGVDTGQVPPVA